MSFGDGDLSVFFADFGIPVVSQGQTTLGLLDAPSSMFEHGGGPGGMESERYCVRIPFNAFTSMPYPGQSITVGGVAYVVKTRTKLEDGKIVEFELTQ
jgi:hypothetical protein